MNKLSQESSPYLLQHAQNPVNWYPWSDQALEKARSEDKPILLSIGYAACHWCHVMAHESFEDPQTAYIMNENFINIKVDREERPDLDSIYMAAVVSITGGGGWPLTVFLTPNGDPFYGGTYFPPEPRHGMPSFQQVLAAVHNAWINRRQEIFNTSSQLNNQIKKELPLVGNPELINLSLLTSAVNSLASQFDEREGGFGNAPKFPPSMTLEFLLFYHKLSGSRKALDMAEHTLTKMANGGIYDQIGGGFARYSTDNNWLVPHFEKMLYDNALLARVYLHAWQVTQNPYYRRVTIETLDYIVREMTHKSGGFYSSQDADSEGVEGKYYVWDIHEIEETLGADAGWVEVLYGISEGGNWEGKNILHIQQDWDVLSENFDLSDKETRKTLDQVKEKLYEIRSQRVPPGLDDKVITGWNGLMMAAFADAGRILDRPDYIQIANRNAEFIYQVLRKPDGRLLRTWRDGSPAKYDAYLEDYVYLAEGLLTLYQTTFEPKWFVWSQELVEIVIQHFSDQENGGFFDTPDDHEELIYRPKDIQDNAIPSGNALEATVLMKLSLLTQRQSYWNQAETSLAALVPTMKSYPNAFAQWLTTACLYLSQPKEIAIVGGIGDLDSKEFLDAIHATYRPEVVIAVGDEQSSPQIPLLTNRPQIEQKVTAYVCRRFICREPTTSPENLKIQLDS